MTLSHRGINSYRHYRTCPECGQDKHLGNYACHDTDPDKRCFDCRAKSLYRPRPIRIPVYSMDQDEPDHYAPQAKEPSSS